jgi:hypothetical protein
MLQLLTKPKGLLPKSMYSSPKKMPPSQQLLTATRISSPRRRFLLPASTFNVPWDRGAQVTRQTTAVLVRRMSFHNCYLVNHYYYNLVPMVPAVNKRFFKSFDLISRQCYLVLKSLFKSQFSSFFSRIFSITSQILYSIGPYFGWYGGRGTIKKLVEPTRPVTVLTRCDAQ